MRVRQVRVAGAGEGQAGRGYLELLVTSSGGAGASVGITGSGREAGRDRPSTAAPPSLPLPLPLPLPPAHLVMPHRLRSRVVRGTLVVVAHMGVAGVQQLTQPKVCRGSAWWLLMWVHGGN